MRAACPGAGLSGEGEGGPPGAVSRGGRVSLRAFGGTRRKGQGRLRGGQRRPGTGQVAAESAGPSGLSGGPAREGQAQLCPGCLEGCPSPPGPSAQVLGPGPHTGPGDAGDCCPGTPASGLSWQCRRAGPRWGQPELPSLVASRGSGAGGWRGLQEQDPCGPARHPSRELLTEPLTSSYSNFQS